MAETLYLHSIPLDQKLHNGLHPAVHHFVIPQVAAGVPAPVGDGFSHPLSTYYASLAAAQIDYPHATGLSQELAWAAIQGGLNSLNANGGGHLLIPRGVYRISDEIKYPSNVRLYGEGAGSRIMNAPDRSGGVYRMLAPVDDTVTGATIENLTFDQNADAFGDNSGSPAISVNNTWRVTVRNCRFRNILTMAVWCDSPEATPTAYLHIANNIIENSLAGGFSLFGAVRNVDIIGNIITATKDDAIAIQARNAGGWNIPINFNVSGNNIALCDHRNSLGSTPNGINIYGAHNGTVSGNSIYRVASNGITLITPDPAALVENVAVAGNCISYAGTSPDADLTGVPRNGIHVYYAEQVSITGNTIEFSAGDGIRLKQSDCGTIAGNMVRTSTLAGIDLEGCSDWSVSGNTLVDNGLLSPRSPTPWGILVNAGAGHGSNDIVITGNRSGNSFDGAAGYLQEYGAFFVSSSTDKNLNILVLNNDFYNNNTDQNSPVQPGDVIIIAGKAYGPTAERPISPSTGQMYFDTDLKIPVFKAPEPSGYVGALGPGISLAGCIPFAEGLDTPGNVLQSSNLRWFNTTAILVIGGQVQLTGTGSGFDTPCRFDNNKMLVAAKIDLGHSSDVTVTGLAANTLLEWDGTKIVSGGGLSAGGNQQVIYNNNGVLAGDPLFLWDNYYKTLTIGNFQMIESGGGYKWSIEVGGSAFIIRDLITTLARFQITADAIWIGNTIYIDTVGDIALTGKFTATASGAYDSISAASGGMKAQSFTATNYTKVGSHAGVPPATAGDTLTTAAAAGAIYWDSTAGTLQVYNGTAWVALSVSGSGNPFSDAAAIIKNATDATKLVKIVASSITTATTRTATMPDRDITLADEAIHQLVIANNAVINPTTSYQTIANLTVTLTRKGWWKVTVEVMASIDHNDTYVNVSVSFNGGTEDPNIIQFAGTGPSSSNYQLPGARSWFFQSTTASETVAARVKKLSGTGTNTIIPATNQGQISAEWLHY